MLIVLFCLTVREDSGIRISFATFKCEGETNLVNINYFHLILLNSLSRIS